MVYSNVKNVKVVNIKQDLFVVQMINILTRIQQIVLFKKNYRIVNKLQMMDYVRNVKLLLLITTFQMVGAVLMEDIGIASTKNAWITLVHGARSMLRALVANVNLV